MRISLVRLVLAVLAVVFALQGCSNCTEPFRSAAGRAEKEAIAVLEPVTLGGTRQWLLVRGADKSKPVLLFLHGGPGNPYIGLAHAFQRELEQNFVVVQWDQRGSGKSFPDTPADSMTLNQFLADTHELVLLLRHRFQREKIYLAGHSWGAYLGIVEAQRHPENLYAYIGAGQIIDLVEQERLSHDFVAEHARRVHNDTALKELADIGLPPYRDPVEGLGVKYSWLWEFGGMLPGSTSPAPLVKAMLASKEYSLMDMVRFARGASFSLQAIARNEGAAFWELKAPDPRVGFRVPVFFITGENDRVTPAALVTDYTNALNAPMKQAYILKDTGHFAFFTDPHPFTEAVVDVLHRTLPKTMASQQR